MKRSVILFSIIGLMACNHPAYKTLVKENERLKANNNYCSNSEYLAQAVLWFQHSPEMRALYLQSYNTAKTALVYNLNHKAEPNKKNAVVVDIDETILNNSAYEGWLYLNNKSYTDASWNAWVQDTKAAPLPGTVDFLNYAKNLGCEIFYVSNRDKNPLFDATLQNLKKYNLPDADEFHLLMKEPGDTTLEGKTTKEQRRLKIENELNYEILLLCGDQVADFSKAFDIKKNGTEQQIKDSVDQYKNEFGSRFIIIPNPMYCDWLRTIVHGNDRNYSCSHVDSLRANKMDSWK